ncbi:MAG: PDZ domain-containing protein, partial [Cyanobacteria bacterium J06643_5]
ITPLFEVKFRELFKLSGSLTGCIPKPNSAAENAGILLGDVLISFDGSIVGDTNDVLGLLNDSSRVGKSVQVQIVRGGELIELNLTIAERPLM